MPRLSIWNSGKKGNDYKFFDRTISEYFGVGGTDVYVYLYEGPYEQQTPGYTPGDFTDEDDTPQALGIQSVEDVLFGENRDRKYNTATIPIKGIYNVNDVDFDMKQFGLFLTNDTLFIEFHLNDMIALLGRRLIPGDVIELPHQRDDTRPDNLPAINKYYQVQEAMRASDGYSLTWWPHIWRVKVEPMTASQEFEDILMQTAKDPLGFATQNPLGDLLSTMANDLGLNEAIVAAAQKSVPKRFFEMRQYYLVCEGVDARNPWIFAGGGDGIPPDGALSLGSGFQFPADPAVGNYYLRTDFQPAALFMWTGSRWCMQEVDWRGTEWSAATTLLKSFINNNAIETYADGLVMPVKQNLSKVIMPRADFITWADSINEVCNAMDSVDCAVDIIEIMNATDASDATYITISDVEEVVSVYDTGIFNYITFADIEENGDAQDTTNEQVVAPIIETGLLVDHVNAGGSIFNSYVSEILDAQDATYVFPAYTIINPKIGYAGGSENVYSIDGLDDPTVQSILTNQMVNPNTYPTNSVIVNNGLPAVFFGASITDEQGNVIVTEYGGLEIIVEFVPQPQDDEAGGGIININIG
jgi:hypothetical protein